MTQGRRLDEGGRGDASPEHSPEASTETQPLSAGVDNRHKRMETSPDWADAARNEIPAGDVEASWLHASDERTDAFGLIERVGGSDALRAYTELRDAMFEAARSAGMPSEPNGVVLWNGGDVAKEAAGQLAAARSAAGDHAVTLGDTPAGQSIAQYSEQLKDALNGLDDASRSAVYEALEQPAWTIASQRLVESGQGRVDVVVRGEVAQEKVLQPEIIKAWNAPNISDIHFHQIVMDGGSPVRDDNGRIILRELFAKDW